MIVFVLYVRKLRHRECRAQFTWPASGEQTPSPGPGPRPCSHPRPWAVRLWDVPSLVCRLCCCLLRCEPRSVLGDSRTAFCGLSRSVVQDILIGKLTVHTTSAGMPSKVLG